MRLSADPAYPQLPWAEKKAWPTRHYPPVRTHPIAFHPSWKTGTSHYIEPLSYEGAIEEAKQRLLDVINGFPPTRVLEVTDQYIHATFTSLLFRFTDDVEFHINDTEQAYCT